MTIALSRPSLRGPWWSCLSIAGLLGASIACGPAADPGQAAIAKAPATANNESEPEPEAVKSGAGPAKKDEERAPPAVTTAPPVPAGPLRAQEAGAYRPCEVAVE